MNPQTLRSMLQLQQTFSGLGGASTGAPPPGGLDFSNLLGTTSSVPAAPMPNPFFNFPFAQPLQQQQSHQAAPGERFRNQLQSLNDMGFTDRSANISALVSAHGNVNRAIEILLEGPPSIGGDAQAADGGPAASSEGQASEETGGGESEAKGTGEKKND